MGNQYQNGNGEYIIPSETFVEIHREGMEKLGFWTEEYKTTIIRAVEASFNEEVTKQWQVVDIVFNDGVALVKWRKRLNPSQKIHPDFR